jgi:hypothetical protein
VAAWCRLIDRQERQQLAMLLYVTRIAHHGDVDIVKSTMERLQEP